MNTSATSVAPSMLTPSVSTVEPLKLTPGQKVTLLDVNSMAAGFRREITIQTVCEPTFDPDYVNAHRGKWRVATFTEKGKRKMFYLDLSQYAILLDGWNLPVILESEKPARMENGFSVRTFSMDACLNIAPAAEGFSYMQARALIDGALFCPPSARLGVVFDGKVLFPDAPGSHAVIERHKRDGKVWASAA